MPKDLSVRSDSNLVYSLIISLIPIPDSLFLFRFRLPCNKIIKEETKVEIDAILGFALSEATGLFALMMSFLLLYS